MSNLTPISKYQDDLAHNNFQYDAAQENAVRHLDRLHHDLVAMQQQRPTGLLSKLFGKNKKSDVHTIKGLYFWGGVGRGKTWLMDTFYDTLPGDNKLRVHFHRFMHRVHDELKAAKGEVDPLKKIAKKLAAETQIICFDEFFVSDITDAMLLGTLFQELFELGIVLVATSNIPPDDLYRNGLQRARFLPAIELIKKHTDVVNVDSGIDYRLRTLEQAEIYHAPLDEQAVTNMNEYFDQLASDPKQFNADIEITGRKVTALKEADGVIEFDFHTLCETARSQTDYMEISRCYHTVLLSSVKQMNANNDDAARRFIALVDEFYERHVKLIISAEVPLDDLYSDGRLTFEFQRCRSRLLEMQSHEYLALEHLP